MRLYQTATRFHYKTGKPYEETVEDYNVCDYCGEMLPEDHHEEFDYENHWHNLYRYNVDVYRGIEEPWYYENPLEYNGELYRPFEAFRAPHLYFDYCRGPGVSCERDLIKDPEIAPKADTFYEFMYLGRLKMLQEVFNDKRYKPEDFGFEVDPF